MRSLYYNGTILTMEGENKTVPSLLIENGRIVKAGGFEELRAYAPDAGLVDLEGRTLMPSFIDGHSHITVAGQMSFAADLSECGDFQDIVNVLKRYLEENKIGRDGLIMGFGYDHNFLREKAHPLKMVLNQVSEEIPIYVLHSSSHMGCANSAALRLAGVHADTPEPEGGSIGRLQGSREPNGYFEEGAMACLNPLLKERLHFDLAEGIRRAQAMYLKYGVTTVQDGASNLENMKLLKSCDDSGDLKIDVAAYPILGRDSSASECFEEFPECDGAYACHLKLGGYKAVLDGSPQGRSAWLTAPYENSGDYCAYPWYTDYEVEGFMRKAVEDRKQILVHCNGDAAGDQFLRTYIKALNADPDARKLDLRPVMIHCQTVRDDQLDIMKRYGIIPSIFVGHVYYWGDVHRTNLGPERGSRISPVRSALNRGLPVNLHQDTPVTKPDMLHSVWTAVNRITRQGSVLGPEQCISTYEALKAVTINPAYAYFEETQKGTLTPGKLADMVILSHNPLATDKRELKDIRVLETIVRGESLYKSGR